MRIFGKLTNVILEVYGNDNDDIAKKYCAITGESLSGKGFIDRKNCNWQNQFRIYFNADKDLLESFSKLGIIVLDSKTPKSIIEEYGKEDGDCPYIISNMYWFWKLVEYGFRLGANENIPYKAAFPVN